MFPPASRFAASIHAPPGTGRPSQFLTARPPANINTTTAISAAPTRRGSNEYSISFTSSSIPAFPPRFLPKRRLENRNQNGTEVGLVRSHSNPVEIGVDLVESQVDN